MDNYKIRPLDCSLNKEVYSAFSRIKTPPETRSSCQRVIKLIDVPLSPPPHTTRMITPTNTLIIVGLSPSDLDDAQLMDSLCSAVKEHTPREQIVTFTKLKKFKRLVMVFETVESATALYKILATAKFDVDFSPHSNKMSVNEFLALPDEGTRFVISPPPSPPSGWVSRPEEGPDTRKIHSPHELSHLLFQRLGDRVETYAGDSIDSPKSKLLLKQLDGPAGGNPIIILDPAQDTASYEFEMEKSVKGVKTARPPTS